MKKHVLLAAGLALGMGVNAQVTLHQENFDSGNPFTGGGATTDYALNCGATANTYCIVTDLGAKYGGANGQTDHTSGTGSMAAYDGFTSGTNRDAYHVQVTSTGGPVTLDFWGHNRFGSHQGTNNVNVNLQIMVDGSTVATEVIGYATHRARYSH